MDIKVSAKNVCTDSLGQFSTADQWNVVGDDSPKLIRDINIHVRAGGIVLVVVDYYERPEDCYDVVEENGMTFYRRRYYMERCDLSFVAKALDGAARHLPQLKAIKSI